MEDTRTNTEKLNKVKEMLNEQVLICKRVLEGKDTWTDLDCKIVIFINEELNKINL